MERAFAGDACALAACARARLDVERVASTSAVTRMYAEYPVKLLAPKAHVTPGSDCAWAYAVSCGGGLVSGDASGTTVRVADGCALALATQGTQKVYKHNKRRFGEFDDKSDGSKSGGGVGETVAALHATVGDGALLAVLPDPTQIFARAVFRQTQAIELNASGSCVCVDWLTAGRIAHGNERWAFDEASLRTRVSVGGEPAVIESQRLRNSTREAMINGDRTLSQRMGAVNVLATLIIIGPRVRALATSAVAWARERARASMLVEGASWIHQPSSLKRDDARFFVSASEITAAESPATGAVLRFFAEDSETVYAALREILAPLEADLGAPPYAERGAA